MNPPCESVWLSRHEIEILNSLKRRTKINHWNVLCRIAFCLSCTDKTHPGPAKRDDFKEIRWNTFAGEYGEIYSAITKIHKIASESTLTNEDYFHCLLSRGINMLNKKELGSIVE